ncbi:nibrin isoform X2 [Leucoraja erinacea]|uniref:nibrin isoform X2 n=1 Tax=Leucoraja erinaceus TaxID=7782 RepID=UPI002456B59C|nr:nibrin isoform X2 [Leucoraja erinacea]
MWILRPVAPGREGPYYLLVGVNYIVGRKNCLILLHEDQSISRSHAQLSVVHPEANLNNMANTSVLTLKDNSKYGTFVNEVRLQNNSPRILKSGDAVTFGVFDSKFRVEYEPLTISSSCLEVPVKIALNHSIQQLGGHVAKNWTKDSTHLVMSSVKITVKTICAMICGRPIVKPEYFVDLIEIIRNRRQIPNPESYSPPIDEPSIKPGELDITVKPERKSIFRGKTFFFLNAKQYKRLSTAITFGGGEAKVLGSSGSNISSIEATGSCIVEVGVSDSQNLSNATEKWIESVMRTLQRKELRAIPEAEIGLAVIYNSTDNYCNPHSKPISDTCSRTMIPGSTLSQSMYMGDMTAPGLSQIIPCVPDTQPSQKHSTREREETEVSQAKFARMEDPDLLDDHHMHVDPSLEKKDSEFTSQNTQNKFISESLKIETSAECSKGNAGPLKEEKTSGEKFPENTDVVCEFKTQKRKQFESPADDVMFSRHEQLRVSKRRNLEAEVLECKVKDELTTENGTKASHLELLLQSENDETIPSKLLLTVFKSLVVCQTGKETQITSAVNAKDTQLKNFKNFRKMLYPGAKALPKIIGGTDLKAYQTKTSSEMEEWLRQEVEDQSQKAKEENLADDLFRYNPKSIKRR